VPARVPGDIRLEPGYDRLRVEAAGPQAAGWTEIAAYTGANNAGFSTRTIALGAVEGRLTTLRSHLQTDGSVTDDGCIWTTSGWSAARRVGDDR